jgi:hypothetical protein
MLSHVHLEYQVALILPILVVGFASENVEEPLSFRLHLVAFPKNSADLLVQHTFGNLYLFDPGDCMVAQASTVLALAG